MVFRFCKRIYRKSRARAGPAGFPHSVEMAASECVTGWGVVSEESVKKCKDFLYPGPKDDVFLCACDLLWMSILGFDRFPMFSRDLNCLPPDHGLKHSASPPCPGWLYFLLFSYLHQPKTCLVRHLWQSSFLLIHLAFNLILQHGVGSWLFGYENQVLV